MTALFTTSQFEAARRHVRGGHSAVIKTPRAENAALSDVNSLSDIHFEVRER